MDCGTCHVYIDPKWRAAVGAPSGPSAPADVRHARRRPFSNGRSVAGPGCGTARGGAGPAGRAALQQRTVGSNGAWTARSPAQALTLAIHPSCLCAPKQVGPLLPSGAHQGARRPGRRAAACAGDSTCTLAASNDATDTHTHTRTRRIMAVVQATWSFYRLKHVVLQASRHTERSGGRGLGTRCSTPAPLQLDIDAVARVAVPLDLEAMQRLPVPPQRDGRSRPMPPGGGHPGRLAAFPRSSLFRRVVASSFWTSSPAFLLSPATSFGPNARHVLPSTPCSVSGSWKKT